MFDDGKCRVIPVYRPTLFAGSIMALSAYAARAIIGQFSTPDDFDAPNVYADAWEDDALLQLLDDENDCSDAGGHVYLTKDGVETCIHCARRFHR